MIFMREQVLMTAAAQNIKRMVKLLSSRGPKKEGLAGIISMRLYYAKLLRISTMLIENINRKLCADENFRLEM